MTEEEIKISMSFREGSSDKVYHAFLKQKDSGWTVFGEYGRRGSTLNLAPKGDFALYKKALRQFELLVKSKTAKGYAIDFNSRTEGGPVSSFTSVSRAKEKEKEIELQLSNPIDLAEVSHLINDDTWGMQEKFDGERRAFRKFNEDILGYNRKGQVVPLPRNVVREARLIPGASFVFDGELVGETIHVFDLLSWPDPRTLDQYGRRLQKIKNLILSAPSVLSNIKLVETFTTSEEKRKAFEEIMERNGEGVIFRKLNAPIIPGRPASGGTSLKYKFFETASFLVLKQNERARSVNLGLFDSTSGDLVDVGNVTIPPNKSVPEKNQIVEVRYLYAYPGGSIYQPTYLGHRTDIEKLDCVIDQLKFKPE